MLLSPALYITLSYRLVLGWIVQIFGVFYFVYDEWVHPQIPELNLEKKPSPTISRNKN